MSHNINDLGGLGPPSFPPLSAFKRGTIGPPPRVNFRGTKDRPFFARSPENWQRWLANAHPGDWCCYWEGDLGASREAPALALDADAALRLQKAAEAIGSAAWRAYKLRRVMLFQSRHALFGFRYLAVRTYFKGQR